MFSDIMLYIPKTETIITISEGTGDNLLDEDIADGYVDYLNYDIGDVADILSERNLPDDGGMIMYKELIQEKFSDLKETIPDVLEDIYGTKNIKYQILGRG